MNNNEKNINTPEEAVKHSRVSKKARIGSYTLGMTVVVLAVIIAINMLIAALPSNFTIFDFSSQKMYTLSDSAEAAIKKVNEDVTLYYVCEGGVENEQMRIYLNKIAGLNSHIRVRTVDPVKDPNFIPSYTSDNVSDQSVIVESERRFKIVDYNDMHYYFCPDYSAAGALSYEEAYYFQAYYGYEIETYFDGEAQMIGALDNVTSSHLPKVYFMTGHGEGSISQKLAGQLDSGSYDIYMQDEEGNQMLNTMNLLVLDGVPDDADIVICNVPQTDLNDADRDKLMDYINNGGSFFLISDYRYTNLPNFEMIMENNGMEAVDGLAIEQDSRHYFQTPYFIIPDIYSNDISKNFGGSYVCLPYAHGIKITNDAKAQPLFDITESGYTVPTTASGTSKVEGSVDGPFALGAMAKNDGNVVWVASSAMFTDTADAYVSGGNYAYFMACTDWLSGRESQIGSDSALLLQESVLVVSEVDKGLWSTIFCIIIPATILVAGIIFWTVRRRR